MDTRQVSDNRLQGPGIYLFILLVCLSCMPEDNLPIRDVGNTPEYFIECYCKPGKMFSLSATSVLPLSNDLAIDFSKKMKITIQAEHPVELQHTIYTLPGSEFVYNYGSTERLLSSNPDSLHLNIVTADQKHISASTVIPPAVSIYSYKFENNKASIQFYTSNKADENYFIYSVEAIGNDSIHEKSVCYLDYSGYTYGHMIEKSLMLSDYRQADKIVFSLKRITRANYDYQISLNAANSANQSSITTPVPLKGNLKGAIGIFTCYTEDRTEIKDF